MKHGIRLCLVTALASVAATAAAQNPMLKLRLVAVEQLRSLSWASLAFDVQGDGLQRRLPDAKELLYAVDPRTGLIWFKVHVHGPVPEHWFGINVAIDNDSVPGNGMIWWGSNKARFDRIASAYLFKAEPYWQGYAGVADSTSVSQNVSSLTRAVAVAVDREPHAILLGIPRSAFGASTVRVIATVGSMIANNDDVPNEGMVTVKLPE